MKTRPSPGMKRGAPSLSGVSLIIVLFGVVILSFGLVLFLSIAGNDRVNTAAFSTSLRSEELAMGGFELIIAELRKEIADPTHSDIESDPGGSGPALYKPKSREMLLPERTASDAIGNLVKASYGGQPLFTGDTATLVASSISSLTPSRNGRAMTIERWNKPALGEFDGADTPAPNWLYIGRNGAVGAPDMSKATSTESSDFVLGRIAYAIYDISGLANTNVAGYPSTLPQADAGKKGSPGLIRLQTLGLSDAAVDALISFRNPAAASNPASYPDLILEAAKEGFSKTQSGSNRFLSRQELIRFAKLHGFDDQLPMLTVFSADKNAPSYQQPQGSISATNPSLLSSRHTASGRLLFEKRFPLSRISLLASLANAPDDPTLVADVAKYFGLTYDAASRSFTYKASAIPTVPMIAAETTYRDPDFFEILKAGILEGSLGQSAGPTAVVGDSSDKDRHIMQLGANIIDQYDLDPDRDTNGQPIPIPTTIVWNSEHLYGVERLPYLNKIYVTGDTQPAPLTPFIQKNMAIGSANADGSGTVKDTDYYGFRMAAELWNPTFQNLPASTDYNPTIRVSMTGATTVTLYAAPDAQPVNGTPAVGDFTPPWSPAGKVDISTTMDTAVDAASTQTQNAPRRFAEPIMMRMAAAVPVATYNKKTAQAGNTSYSSFHFRSLRAEISDPISVTLQVLDQNGVARTYHESLPTKNGLEMLLTGSTSPNTSAANTIGSTSISRSDPRTNRLGMYATDFRPSTAAVGINAYRQQTGSLPLWAPGFAPNATTSFSLRPRFGLNGDPNGYGVATTDKLTPSPYSTGGADYLYLGLLYENTIAATRVADPDGVYRQGDGGFLPGSATVNPLEPTFQAYTGPVPFPKTTTHRPPGVNAARPVHLDRTFSSVADMGYTFRDSPWKSLNFSSQDSADAALLDLFDLCDTDVVEGRVNLNTANVQLIAALLTGSTKEEGKSGEITETQATAVATALRQLIDTDGPLNSLSEFVTRFSSPDYLPASILGMGADGNPSIGVKTQRESIIRALAGSTQTRTWNLLIDLVAQSGRFPTSATTADQFAVEGERRYWLHVAIDRYTGEVVSRLLEQVNE